MLACGLQIRTFESEMVEGSQGTTLEQDQELLAKGVSDPRLEAAVRYRSERKLLLREARDILSRYKAAYYPA